MSASAERSSVQLDRPNLMCSGAGAARQLLRRARLPVAAAACAVLARDWRPDCETAQSGSWLPWRTAASQREARLRETFADYNIGCNLGSGAFATVKLAQSKETGEEYALKVIDKGSTTTSAIMEKELAVLRRVGVHRHIVSMLDQRETEDSWSILLELVTGGEVKQVLVFGSVHSPHLHSPLLHSPLLHSLLHHSLLHHSPLLHSGVR